MQRTLLSLILATLLLGCSGKSLDPAVPPVSDNIPEPLAWWSRAAINAYMDLEVSRGTRSGFVVMLARDGVPVYANA